MQKIKGFVAYPAHSAHISHTLVKAIQVANTNGWCNFESWEQNDIPGRQLIAPIYEKLDDSNLLIADITKLNFNVTYEVGYAIGIKKRVFLVKNTNENIDNELVDRIGIFDTLGYEGYKDSDELAKILSNITDLEPMPIPAYRDRNTPAYVLETPVKSDSTIAIVSWVKKARLFYRSFVPTEESRLSAIDAIRHVSRSFGVVVPLLPPTQVDADIHNIRAAFIAGLSHGLEIETLILQDSQFPDTPLDIRDFVKLYSRADDIRDHIHEFSQNVYEAMDQKSEIKLPSGNLLSSISIGDPMAENEFQDLGKYYIQTDEFRRAIRGEINLVVGRKGTGKTAFFSQLRNEKRANRENIVVDLKPEGYQLMKLKEDVLDYLSAGAKSHLVTAFWEYLLFLEICYKILEKDREKHLRDHTLTDGYIKLDDLYKASPYVSEGDFSERLSILSSSISQEYGLRGGGGEPNDKLTSDDVTSLIHSNNIRELKTALGNYLTQKEEVWVLFDNIDKGWSTQGLVKGDVIILRCLIDAARKVQNEMRRYETSFYTLVFVRNDVYQLLMDNTADFGKESRASLDWDDPDLLRDVLCERLVHNMSVKVPDFSSIWSRICISHYEGEETSQFLIERSLMRPRNLIKLFGIIKGFASNLQHEKILEVDIEKGLRSYSIDLVIDADQELTDIEPAAKNLIYQFLGESSSFTAEELKIIFDMNSIEEDMKPDILNFLLYYGFLGIKYSTNDPVYIYNVGYNLQILLTRISKNAAATCFVLNPAFWPALGIED